MLISLGQRRGRWAECKKVGRGDAIGHRQQGASGARSAVSRIVRVMCICPGNLHMGPGISTELPFEHRADGKEQLRGHEKPNR